MKIKSKQVLWLMLVALMTSCNLGPDVLAPNELHAWYADPENGFVVKREVNSIIYEARKKPLDWMIANKNKGIELTAEEYQMNVKDFEGVEYYELIISHSNGSDILKHGIGNNAEYLGRIDYLSYRAKEQISLEQNGIINACVLYHFERSYGLGKQIVINLGFPKTGAGESVLLFEDGIFGSGTIKFRFEEKQEPKLKLKA